jgi:hypothetical protein
MLLPGVSLLVYTWILHVSFRELISFLGMLIPETPSLFIQRMFESIIWEADWFIWYVSIWNFLLFSFIVQ